MRGVDCADQAIDFIRKNTNGYRVAGAGVDAPLWWSSGPSSDRRADQWIRKSYQLTGGQVQATNSLRGAALVQGVMFAFRIREAFPHIHIGITETHPKAILRAFKINNWHKFAEKYSLNVDGIEINEHMRDAVISAVAAREGFEGRWKCDLSVNRNSCEQNPKSFWLAPIHYYWPAE